MANIINTDFFYEPLEIPQLTEGSVTTSVNNWIKSLEPEYLEKVLGSKLFREFITGIGAVSPDAKWLALRDGADYEVEGVTKRWNGFKYVIDDMKKSPIANYVYFYYIRKLEAKMSPDGENKTSKENSVPQSSGYNQMQAWNGMVEQNRILYEFLYANQDDYQSYFDTLSGSDVHGSELYHWMTRFF